MDTNMFQILARHSDPDSQAAAELVRSVSASYHSEWEAALFMISRDQLPLAEAYLLSRAEELLKHVGNQLHMLVNLCKQLREEERVEGMMKRMLNSEAGNHRTTKKKKDITSPLFTPQAEALWAKAEKAGFVDSEHQPLLSQRRAAILAMVMGDTLNLEPRWPAFEQLWGISNLANWLSKANEQEYYDPLRRKIIHALS